MHPATFQQFLYAERLRSREEVGQIRTLGYGLYLMESHIESLSAQVYFQQADRSPEDIVTGLVQVASMAMRICEDLGYNL